MKQVKCTSCDGTGKIPVFISFWEIIFTLGLTLIFPRTENCVLCQGTGFILDSDYSSPYVLRRQPEQKNINEKLRTNTEKILYDKYGRKF